MSTPRSSPAPASVDTSTKQIPNPDVFPTSGAKHGLEQQQQQQQQQRQQEQQQQRALELQVAYRKSFMLRCSRPQFMELQPKP